MSKTYTRIGEGFVLIKADNGKVGLNDSEGRQICKPEYDFIDNFFVEGVAIVRKGDLYGFVNAQGQPICECKYRMVDYFINGCAPVQKQDGTWTGIDHNGVESFWRN